MTLVALIQARDEERFLPGWLENVGSIVDGIVALDDGSHDATYEILRSHPKAIEVLRAGPRETWDERANQIALIDAGRRHGASWFLCIDADERLEKAASTRIPQLLSEADRDDISVFSFQLRELWRDRHHYRVDGIWNGKVRYRLFRNDPSHRRFDPRRLHRFWFPLELASNLSTVSRHSGLNMYHLKTISPADRALRVARYEALDPDHIYQRIGYSYLADERGLQLARVPIDRGFLPADDPGIPSDSLVEYEEPLTHPPSAPR